MMPPRRPTKWYLSPRSSNPQRSVFDFHFDTTAALPDHACGEAFLAVIDGKADAGLGRCIGMTDRGRGKGPAQAIKHGLVGDLARQPNITRRKARERSTHQKFAPVRWGAR